MGERCSGAGCQNMVVPSSKARDAVERLANKGGAAATMMVQR